VHSAAMRIDAANSGESILTTSTSPSSTHQPAVKFVRLAQLRKLRGCEKVAAVCYRVGTGGIEFLLVRTGSGHWTFPKGHAEPGLTYAQAAALEAFEEAGVHGRIEEASFAKYVVRKRGEPRNITRSGQKTSQQELTVQAHLCEVSRLDPPQERHRNPTWFSAEKAKRRLREDRTPDYGAELARVVDRAVSRIRRKRRGTIVPTDGPPRAALQKVEFIDSVRRTLGRSRTSRTG
jgi:8-oxo-dGTP pyrophosphatase MutT (NUDIX family)